MTTRTIPVNRTVYVEKTIHVIECANCQIDFGIGDDFMRRRREDHAGFYCPNGHSNVYNGPSDAEKRAKKAERELDAARSLAARESERRRLAEGERAAARGEVTRLRTRVGNGVCPCCNRTFKDLGEHMAGQHPDFRLDEDEPNVHIDIDDLSPNQLWTLQSIARHVDQGEAGALSLYYHRATVGALVRRGVVTLEDTHDDDLGPTQVVVPTVTGLRLIAEAGIE